MLTRSDKILTKILQDLIRFSLRSYKIPTKILQVSYQDLARSYKIPTKILQDFNKILSIIFSEILPGSYQKGPRFDFVFQASHKIGKNLECILYFFFELP